MGSPTQHDWPIQRLHSTLPANRSTNIGCKEPGVSFFELSLLKYPNTRSFNAEAKGAQMLYRLTFDSQFRCLKRNVSGPRTCLLTRHRGPYEWLIFPAPLARRISAGARPGIVPGVLAKVVPAALICLASVSATYGQETALSVPMMPGLEGDSALAYADLVDLALPAQVVARGQVRKAIRLKPEEAPGVPAGRARLYIEATHKRAADRAGAGRIGAVPGRCAARCPRQGAQASQDRSAGAGARGAGPAGRAAAGRARCHAGADTPGREATLRAILTETARPDAPPTDHGAARSAPRFRQSGG